MKLKSIILLGRGGEVCTETVVISDLSVKKLPRSVTDLRDTAGMKVLGTEWIIQCLIQGKVVEFKPFLLPANMGTKSN